MPLRGRAQVLQGVRQFDDLMTRAHSVRDPYQASDYARLLVVLLSGLVEAAISELAMERSRKESFGATQSFIVSMLERAPNPTPDAIKVLLGRFDADWAELWENYLSLERKAALGSVVGLRNNIAHGRQASPSLGSVTGYYHQVREVLIWLVELMDPVPG